MEKSTGKKADGSIVFYIEALVLLAVFTAVITVLMNGFSSAEKLSRKAASLSCAVHLAQNAAEMASASKSGDMLFGMLDENGNACVIEEDASRAIYSARYDEAMMPAADGIFRVDVSWAPKEGGMAESKISVYRNDGDEPLYALELGIYIGSD